jgi:hypothetical protein
MVVAAFGYIPPLIGAFMQEVIDVAVFVNALRAATEPLRHAGSPPARRAADSRMTADPSAAHAVRSG